MKRKGLSPYMLALTRIYSSTFRVLTRQDAAALRNQRQ